MLLVTAAPAGLVEDAVGRFGEHAVHGVVPLPNVLTSVFQHVCPVLQELKAEEPAGGNGTNVTSR